MSQLSLFAPRFDERVRRVEIDGVTYFSVTDIFMQYGSEGSRKDPRKYWERALKRLVEQGADVVTGVSRHQFEGQGQRSTPVITFRLFLRLVQVVEIAEWEAMRDWMAEIAQERIEESANPELGLQRARERARLAWQQQGKDERWISARTEGAAQRNTLTSVLQDVISDRVNFAEVTDHVYLGLCQHTAKMLRQVLNVPSNRNLRDYFSVPALGYTRLAEHGIEELLKNRPSLSYAEALSVIDQVATLIGAQARGMSAVLGRDIFTDRPLLEGKPQ